MSDISNQAAQAASDAVMSKVATGMTVGGGGTAFVGGLALNEFAMIFGMLIGLLGLCLQAYQTLHKRRVYVAEHKAIEERSRREEEEHRAKMEMYL
jgi:hypothetical protein